VSERLSNEVTRLIAEHITSVEQLEILLLLRSTPEREWSAHQVSDAIRTSEQSAARRLEDLHARGFLSARGDSPPHYTYSPSSRSLGDAVSSLASSYAALRYTVIDAIFSKPIQNLRVYADAFRLREDRDNG
jgi:predicted ArsR family transcriptional regulator